MPWYSHIWLSYSVIGNWCKVITIYSQIMANLSNMSELCKFWQDMTKFCKFLKVIARYGTFSKLCKVKARYEKDMQSKAEICQSFPKLWPIFVSICPGMGKLYKVMARYRMFHNDWPKVWALSFILGLDYMLGARNGAFFLIMFGHFEIVYLKIKMSLMHF